MKAELEQQREQNKMAKLATWRLHECCSRYFKWAWLHRLRHGHRPERDWRLYAGTIIGQRTLLIAQLRDHFAFFGVDTTNMADDEIEASVHGFAEIARNTALTAEEAGKTIRALVRAQGVPQ